MTLDGLNANLTNKNLAPLNVEDTSVPAEISTNELPAIDFSQSDTTDTTELNNISANSNKVEKKYVRNVDELYNSIQGIFTQYNISVAKAKEIGLLSSISGKSEEELLDAPQAEINKIINLIKSTIDALKEDNIEVNIENLEKYARLYNIQITNGWDSVASFRKANKKNNEGLTERLYRFRTGKKLDEKTIAVELSKFKNLSTEKKAEKLESYFSRYFTEEIDKKIKNASSPEEIERIKEEVRVKQITDFTKLLFNSSPEEYEIFADAIEYLAANKRYAGFDAILKSCDTKEQKIKISDYMTFEKVQKTHVKIDKFGDKMTAEDMRDFTALTMQYKTEDASRKYHEDATNAALSFYTQENIDKLDAIYAKKDKDIPLTPEEQELLMKHESFKGDNSGQMIGVGINQVMNSEAKEDILNVINADAYKIGEKAGNDFYRKVMEGVVDYVEDENNSKSLTMSQEEFVKLLNKVTNGNYDKILNDITQGTKTELSVPSFETKSTQTTQNATGRSVQNTGVDNYNNVDPRYNSDGVSTKVTANDIVSNFYSKCSPNKNNAKEDNVDITRSSTMKDCVQNAGGSQGFNEYASLHGLPAAITATLNSLSNHIVLRTLALNLFENCDENKQANIIKSLCNEGLRYALDVCHLSTLKRLEGTKLGTYYATSMLNDKISEESKA